MVNDSERNFVEAMLKSSKEKKEAKPQSRFEGVNMQEVEKFTENLRERIQKGRKQI